MSPDDWKTMVMMSSNKRLWNRRGSCKTGVRKRVIVTIKCQPKKDGQTSKDKQRPHTTQKRASRSSIFISMYISVITIIKVCVGDSRSTGITYILDYFYYYPLSMCVCVIKNWVTRRRDESSSRLLQENGRVRPIHPAGSFISAGLSLSRRLSPLLKRKKN